MTLNHQKIKLDLLTILGIAGEAMRTNREASTGWFTPKTEDSMSLAVRAEAKGLLVQRLNNGRSEYRLTQKGADVLGTRFIPEAPRAVPNSSSDEIVRTEQEQIVQTSLPADLSEDEQADIEAGNDWHENEAGELVSPNHPDLVGHKIAETVLNPGAIAQDIADLEKTVAALDNYRQIAANQTQTLVEADAKVRELEADLSKARKVMEAQDAAIDALKTELARAEPYGNMTLHIDSVKFGATLDECDDLRTENARLNHLVDALKIVHEKEPMSAATQGRMEHLWFSEIIVTGEAIDDDCLVKKERQGWTIAFEQFTPYQAGEMLYCARLTRPVQQPAPQPEPSASVEHPSDGAQIVSAIGLPSHPAVELTDEPVSMGFKHSTNTPPGSRK